MTMKVTGQSWRMTKAKDVNWEREPFFVEKNDEETWYIYQAGNLESETLEQTGFRLFGDFASIFLRPSWDGFERELLFRNYLTAMKIQDKIDHICLIESIHYIAVIPGFLSDVGNGYIFAFLPAKEEDVNAHGVFYISTTPIHWLEVSKRRFAAVKVTIPRFKITPVTEETEG